MFTICNIGCFKLHFVKQKPVHSLRLDHGVQGVTIVYISWCSQQGLHERQNLVLQNAVANNGTSVSPLPHSSVTYKKEGST
jgi:hypothetical protein